MNKPRTVVLGGTGFIGSHVAEQLLQAGYPITALVRRHGSESNRLACDGIYLKIW